MEPRQGASLRETEEVIVLGQALRDTEVHQVDVVEGVRLPAADDEVGRLQVDEPDPVEVCKTLISECRGRKNKRKCVSTYLQGFGGPEPLPTGHRGRSAGGRGRRRGRARQSHDEVDELRRLIPVEETAEVAGVVGLLLFQLLEDGKFAEERRVGGLLLLGLKQNLRSVQSAKNNYRKETHTIPRFRHFPIESVRRGGGCPAKWRFVWLGRLVHYCTAC